MTRQTMSLAAALAAVAAAGALTAPVASADELTGSMRIREVKLLQPTRGAENGSLLAWIRVDHARARHTARAVAGASHRGRMTIALRGTNRASASGVAVRDLDLPTHDTVDRASHAYAVRFPRGAARLLLAARSERVRLSARVDQRLDLDGDGRAEDADSAQAIRMLSAQTVAQTISPKQGQYTGYAGGVGYTFTVANGAFTAFHADAASSCKARTLGSAPIDPVSGAFSYSGRGQIVATVKGRFTPDSKGSLTGSAQGRTGTRTKVRPCSFRLSPPSAFQYGYVAPIPGH